MLPFLPAAFENGWVTASLVARSPQLWPLSAGIFRFFHEEENDSGFCFSVRGGDGAGGSRPGASPGLSKLLRRLARHHGWRPRFLPSRHAQRIEPDPPHHRDV